MQLKTLLISTLCLATGSLAVAQKTTFGYVGGTNPDQSYTVPSGTYRVFVKLWGAGGGNLGGSGAFVSGSVSVVPGEILTIIAGQGGMNVPTKHNYSGRSYGGGGSAYSGKTNDKGVGGGMAAIFRGVTPLVVAGAGGGGDFGHPSDRNYLFYGGGGGILVGGEPIYEGKPFGVKGGGQNSGGSEDAGQFFGANNRGEQPGGGSGYWGGATGWAGAGGSSFVDNLSDLTTEAGQVGQVEGSLPGGSTIADYVEGIGLGGRIQGRGGNGLVVIDPVLSLKLTPTTIPGTTDSIGTIRLTQAVPVGQTVTVDLTSDSNRVSIPKTVTVLGGNTFAEFRITTKSVSEPTIARISASVAGGLSTESVTINPTTVKAVTFSPSSIFGGTSQEVVGKLTLDSKPSADSVVSLTSNSEAITLPSTVKISKGLTTGTFQVVHRLVPSETSVVVTATLNGRSTSGTVILKPVLLSAISIGPSLIAGDVIQGRVGTDQAAPKAGFGIELSGSSTNARFSPPNPSIPSGLRSAAFDLQAADSLSVTESFVISAKFNGKVQTRTVKLYPIQVQSASVSPSQLKGGAKAILQIGLNSSHVGRSVTASISVSGNVATAPELVTFAAGESTKRVEVSTSSVAKSTTITITIKLKDSTKAVKLYITK